MCWALKNHTERKLALGGDTSEIVVGITKKLAVNQHTYKMLQIVKETATK